VPLQQQYSLTAGQSLQQANLGFPAYGLIVENITNQWYYESSRRRFIPPYQAGVTIPLVGLQTGTLQALPPGQIVQASPVPGEYLVATYFDAGVQAGGGINVSGISGPTPLPVSSLDLAQGGQPASPALGLTRLWADASGALHRLLTTGNDALEIDSSTALGGVLTGTLPNPGMAAGAAAANVGALGGDLTGSSLPNPVVAAGVITLAKLAANSVDSSKIVDGTIVSADIAVGAITTFSAVYGSSPSPTTTSTTAVDMPDMTITVNSPVACLYRIDFAGLFICTVGTGYYVLTCLVDGGVVSSNATQIIANATTSAFNHNHTYGYVGVAAGSHVVKMQWNVAAGTLQAYQTTRALSVLEVRR
jgi:hypothetical protein